MYVCLCSLHLTVSVAVYVIYILCIFCIAVSIACYPLLLWQATQCIFLVVCEMATVAVIVIVMMSASASVSMVMV